MNISYLFYLTGILMLNRRIFLFMTPVIIAINWRFGSVTTSRNFTVDEMLVAVSAVKIVQYIIIRRFEYQMPALRWYIFYLLGVVFTFSMGVLILQNIENVDFRDVVMVYIKERMYMPVVFAAVFIQLRDREEGLTLLRWAALIGIPISIYSIIQYHFFIVNHVGDYGSFWLYSWYSEEDFEKAFWIGRSFGTQAHPAALGRYLMFIVILGLVQGIHRLEGSRPWWPGLVIVILAFYALGTSGSRAAMISLVAAIGAIIYLERKSFSRNLIIGIIAIMAFSYAVPEVMTSRMEDVAEEGMETGNVAGRIEIWSRYANDFISINPITGVGFTTFSDYHNDFLGITYEGGIVLIVLFVLWLLSIYQLGMAGTRQESRLSQMCGVIIIGCLVAICGSASSGRTFFTPKIGLEFMYILAVCGKLITLEGRQQARRARMPRAGVVRP